MTQTPQLYVVDGMALLFRSFYAMNRVRMTAPDGTPTGAVYGFLKVIFKILRERTPTHFAVTWDRQEKTFRHEMFTEYKSNRSAMPDDLRPQVKLIKELIPEIGLPSLSIAGFEGDDVIGTLAKRFSTVEGGDVYIVSADKDFMQLIDNKVKMLSIKTGDDFEVLGRNNVIDYFGVPPEKVIDLLAIRGDTSDFVPGVKGIGEKGAAKLINEFGSLENLYANLDRVANKRTRELLEASRENAMLSQKLVTICVDCPVDANESLVFDWNHFVNNPKMKERLDELRMVTLVKSLYGAHTSAVNDTVKSVSKEIVTKQTADAVTDLFAVPAAEQPTEASTSESHAEPTNNTALWGKRDYSCIRTKVELAALAQKISSTETKHFAFDTETTGLDFIEDRLIGMSFAFHAGEAFYLPLNSAHSGSCEFEENEALEAIQKALVDRKATLVAHNLKFDWHHMLNAGLDVGSAPVACSMVAAWLLDSISNSYGLDAQTLKHLKLQKIPTSQLIGKASGRKSMIEVPVDEITEYACEDVDATLRLWELFEPDLRGANLTWLFWDLEMPLLKVLLDMERSGVHVNRDYLEKLNLELQSRIMEIENQVYEMAGQVFNLSSPKQLGNILFEHIRVHEKIGYKGKLAKTSLGYKTDVNVLETFSAHPVVALIMEHRELSKLLSTYVFVLPNLVKKSTQRIHTCFNQIGTATGRLSSTDPNLQNIPVRTDWGKKVRAAFSTSRSENVIISADYSQIELRVLAHLAKDETMHQAFQSGLDIHRETAAKILGKDPKDITSEERSSAKAINFGIIYGMGPQRLAREQGISMAQAKSFIEKYFLNFSRIREYLDSQKVFAHQNGYVSTHFGRPRRIYGLGSANPGEVRSAENMAINSPIQGTAADIMKLGMLRLHRGLKEKNLKTRLLLQVHDEVVLEGPQEEFESVKALVKEALEGAVDFTVPLLVEVGSGQNWLEAK